MSGFAVAEYETRLSRAQSAMAQAGFAALLVTTEAEVRYFTGFLTRFWESPSRPWFVVIPAEGKPIAVIPAIGAALMAKTWVDDIRTWPAPVPEDDGVTLLADTLREVISGQGFVIHTMESPLTITASIGLAVAHPQNNQTAPRLIEAADAALYASKADGRNRTSLAKPA